MPAEERIVGLYWIIVYERHSDEWLWADEVPVTLEERVLSELGIEPFDCGEMPLRDDQVRMLAGILGHLRPDFERHIYHLGALGPLTEDGL